MTWFHDFDAELALDQYPVGDAFTKKFTSLSRDELYAQQNASFLRLVARASSIAFYQKLWAASGVQAGDIKSLEDLSKLPAFGKSEIMASIEAHPPYGDFHGMSAGDRVVLHTTSGTTGRPQPMLYGVRGREIQNLLLARAYRFQGLRDDDVVHSIYGFGMVNGGHYIREAILHFTRAMLLPAGTGVETRSARQVQLMNDFRVTVLLGFADYMRKLGETAIELGLEPGRDIPLRLISGHMGRESKDAISHLWGGATVLDWYGVGDTGIIAAEGPDQDGLYLFEDAHLVEILGTESGQPVPDGHPGNLVTTVLFKDDIYPMIRFNTQDVTRILPGQSALGINLRRIEGFLGRSDNMVKIRGINVYPHAIAAWLGHFRDLNGEYLCEVSRHDGRDELCVRLETRDEQRRVDNNLATAVRQHLAAQLGVDVVVQLEAPGGLDRLTEVLVRQKAIRLVDRRFD
ncbi:MAG: AMP-binding protein [Burkholderiaceae bacterium]